MMSTHLQQKMRKSPSQQRLRLLFPLLLRTEAGAHLELLATCFLPSVRPHGPRIKADIIWFRNDSLLSEWKCRSYGAKRDLLNSSCGLIYGLSPIPPPFNFHSQRSSVAQRHFNREGGPRDSLYFPPAYLLNCNDFTIM